MKKLLIRILISAIIGITLGVITELALIFELKNLAVITQTEAFWLIVILIGLLFSNNIREAIITNILTIDLMTISYYIVRLFYSGYTNWLAMRNYFVIGTFCAIVISILLQLPKKGKYISILGYFFIIIYFIGSYSISTISTLYKHNSYYDYLFISITGVIICIISIAFKILRREDNESISSES